MMNLTQTTSNQCSLQRKQINFPVKRRASSNLENSSKIFMLTNITDQPSVSDVKPEPVFIGSENIAVPDPANFCSYCSVSDYAVGTDADELV